MHCLLSTIDYRLPTPNYRLPTSDSTKLYNFLKPYPSNFFYFGRMEEKAKKYKMGITLSGGSARAYAHAGVLKALAEHGIEPEIISGTSMGAVVGALYAAGHSPEKIEKILLKNSVYKILGFSLKKTGLMKLEKLRKLLEKYVPENFSELRKPLYIGLSNLNEAKKEIYHSGSLYEYLIATCSAPGIFAPRVINGNSYVDGGLMCNLPASAIRDKCEILIGSHVNYPGTTNDLAGPKEVLIRTILLGINQNAKPEMELCDYLIDPPSMQDYSLVDFKKTKVIMKAGYEHTIKMIKKGELPVGERV